MPSLGSAASFFARMRCTIFSALCFAANDLWCTLDLSAIRSVDAHRFGEAPHGATNTARRFCLYFRLVAFQNAELKEVWI